MTTQNPSIHITRVTVLLATLAVFLSLWLTIAMHPWQTQSAAPIQQPVAAQPVNQTPSAAIGSQQPVTVTRSS